MLGGFVLDSLALSYPFYPIGKIYCTKLKTKLTLSWQTRRRLFNIFIKCLIKVFESRIYFVNTRLFGLLRNPHITLINTFKKQTNKNLISLNGV